MTHGKIEPYGAQFYFITLDKKNVTTKWYHILAIKVKRCLNWYFEFEFIGVLRHMQRYFSHTCDGTDVQADWRSCTYGRAPNAIDISQGSLTCLSYTDTGLPFLYGDSDTPPHLVAFYDTLGIRRTYSRLKPPASSRGVSYSKNKSILEWTYKVQRTCLCHSFFTSQCQWTIFRSYTSMWRRVYGEGG